MNDIVSAMDALKIALSTETVLRQSANVEWASGNQNGPMKAAHDASIQQVMQAARYLVSLAQ